MMRIIEDLPFQTSGPAPLGLQDWLIVMLGLATGLLALLMLPVWRFPFSLVPTSLFAALPLVALALVAGRHWCDLFRRLTLRSPGAIVLFGLLTLIVSVAMALVLRNMMHLADNPAAASFQGLSGAGFVITLLPTLPQLLGEELLAILPMLAVFSLTRRASGDHAALLAGVLTGTLVFAAAHLPTYDWNLMQCLALIGSARIVLTLAYLATRNIWVSTGAHILNDWSEFTLIWLGAGLAPPQT